MRRCLLLVILNVGLLSACSATIPKPYDLVQALSLDSLQQSIMEFFQSYPILTSNKQVVSGNSACQYQQHQAFYKQGLMDAHTLVVRAQAVPQGQASVKPYEELLGNLYSLRAEHQQACFTQPQVELHRQRFAEILGAIN